ncbi:hypothetical protein IKF76_00120 [Candidatus Saccharibacteria bacterium]|nr:hypothetical protein [Candidatus Saccharibacteria bacterium]
MNKKEIESYYVAFKKLCTACGKFAWADKLMLNDADGVFPAQKVKHETFGKNGNADANLQIEVERARHTAFAAAANLDYWSRRVGFKPMSEKDTRVLLGHLYDGDFRKKLQYRINRNVKKELLASARDLVIEVLKVQSKSYK